MTRTIDRTSTRGRVRRDHSRCQAVVARRPAVRTRAGDVASKIRALDSRIRGTIVLRGEPGWDVARAAWDIPLEKQPAAIVQVTSLDDVVAVTGFARTHGLRFTSHGGELWAIAVLDGFRTTECKGDSR